MTINRRNFIKTGLLLTGSMGLHLLPSKGQSSSKSSKKLILVFLRGGADVLSLFPPKSTGASKSDFTKHPLAPYRSLNHENSKPKEFAQKFLMGTTVDKTPTAEAFSLPGFNVDFHPALLDLKKHLDTDNFALLLHTGSLNTTRSHFDQMDYMESGGVEKIYNSGFLARLAHRIPNQVNAPQAIALGRGSPKSLRGYDSPLIQNPTDILQKLYVGNKVNGNQLSRSQRLELFKDAQGSPCIESLLCRTAHWAQSHYSSLEKALSTLKNQSTSVFQRECEMAAHISRSDLSTSVITLDLGGWDHHFQENPTIPNSSFYAKAQELSKGLSILAEGISEDSLVVVLSEFGRTVCANPSLGTDHGRGSAMMVFGKAVRKSKLTNSPTSWDLEKLEGDKTSEALTVKIDFREVLAEIFEKHLGVTPNSTVSPQANLDLSLLFENLKNYTARNFLVPS